MNLSKDRQVSVMTAKTARTVSKGNVRLEFEGLGPLVKGSVEIKPLTVFIGPNGSGKSYTAMLLYALYKGIAKQPFIYTSRELKEEIRRIGKPNSERDYYRYIYDKLRRTLHKDIYEGFVTIFGDIYSPINIKTNRLNRVAIRRYFHIFARKESRAKVVY